MIRAAIVGGSGFVGGELLRILLGHPQVEVAAVTSRSHARRRVDTIHPNLRGITDLTFSSLDGLDACDIVFNATPHGVAMTLIPELVTRAKHVIDLSADFRIRDPHRFARHYGRHEAWQLVNTFVTGLPELYRGELGWSDRIAVPGCMATAAILALHPLAARRLLAPQVDVDARTGSSGAGGARGPINAHPVRSGALRVFAPLGHRHEAEIEQATGLTVRMTATGVEAVRGVQVLCRATLHAGVTERDLWRVYREHYAREPFVRLVRQRSGAYRYPEPKILVGSNFCDIGFALDASSRRLVVIAALDNLVKGAAGNAVQCLNVRMGWSERFGLEFPGLHPA